jgi:hypothetical protein
LRAGELAAQPLRHFGTILGEHLGPQPYPAWQKVFDPLFAPGARNYWKSRNFASLEGGLLQVLVEHAEKVPWPDCEICIAQLGGRVGRISPGATAFGNRDVAFVITAHGRWERAEQDAAGTAWARSFYWASELFATRGTYINFLPGDEIGRVGSAFGLNYERLIEVKRKYDPTNFFQMNQNIAPYREALSRRDDSPGGIAQSAWSEHGSDLAAG